MADDSVSRDGGYSQGYQACPCFWGSQPGSLVRAFAESRDTRGLSVLDAGCGEGKNAVYLAGRGAYVTAVEIDEKAIRNGQLAWPHVDRIEWVCGDIQALSLPPNAYDIVVAYGLFHCMRDASSIEMLVKKLRGATRDRGIHIVCSFNSRSQDLSAHPGFSPTLLSHIELLNLYGNDQILSSTDLDLIESHPHNGISHSHSLTRIVVEVQHG